MPIIHVKEKCTFTDASGRRHDFAVGSHDVSHEIATHGYVQAHCSGQPIPVLPADPAGALAELRDLLANRESAVETCTATLYEMQRERDTLADQVAELVKERDALASQVADLGNQIAELQAGGETPAAAGGKSKKG